MRNGLLNKKQVVVNNNSVGFCGLLAIVFIVLKLVGTIDWSWLWVLSPLWIPLAIVLTICGIGLICVVVAAIVAGLIGLVCDRRSK